MSRLRDRYEKEVAPALKKEFGYKNVMAIPKIEKVVVNMGLGEATQNAKIVDTGADEVARITGQKPVATRAKKSIAQFKVRKGMPIGAMVTLRGERMWEFLDRLISVALPRVRDFRGVSAKGFDGRGNYTLGLKDQLLFPEIDYMKVDKARGMNISVVTTAKRVKDSQGPKFAVRLHNRCRKCGRSRAYLRKFALCRLCFRKLALEGDVTGVTKSSW